jgi:hypothetical protein
MWSGGARAWPAGAGGGMGARAREKGGRKIVGKLWWQKRKRREEEERRMGSTPTRVALFIEGSTNPPFAVPSAIQHASTALFREVRAKITVDSLLIG